MNQYTNNTLIQLNITITNAAGNPVDPTTLDLKVMTPDGVVTDYAGSIVRTSVGIYYAQLLPVQIGLHQYEWIGTGAAQVATIGQFLINQGTF